MGRLISNFQYKVMEEEGNNTTPLHWSCQEGHLLIVEYLVYKSVLKQIENYSLETIF